MRCDCKAGFSYKRQQILKNVYISVNQHFKKIGLYCVRCGKFIPLETKENLEEKVGSEQK